ncbi:site-2 protease family protein, partial [Candidatus Collierbacteria bacterium]|nr:site-2 protease family protein [Candidatus Collierbacteria bacterium]
ISDFRFQISDFKIKETDQLVKLINENKGKEVTLTIIDKEGKEREVKVVPREKPPEGEGSLGVVLTSVEFLKFPWWQMPFRGVVVGLKEAIAWGKDIAGGFWQIVYGLITGKGVAADVKGPVGIYEISGQVVRQGIIPTLQFMGVLSVNLAILNIMPLPALDGGRLLFLPVEWIIGKKRKNKVEGYVNTVGMIFLLSLMLLITIRDVIGLIQK